MIFATYTHELLAVMSGTQLVMLGMAIIGLTILMISTRKNMVRRSSRPRETVSTIKRKLEDDARLHRDLDQVMIELDQLSRQIHARIDTKFAKLEAVIRDADHRIAELKGLVGTDSADQLPAADEFATRSGIDITVDESTDDVIRGLEPTPATPATASTTVAGSATPHDRVHGLQDQGFTPGQIAERLDMPVGEIELIISLRKAREKFS